MLRTSAPFIGTLGFTGTAKNMINSEFPKPGDIALVTGNRQTSRILVKMQSMARGTATYSHCAINFNYCLWCHATPDGVGVITTTELFKGDEYASDWRVIRRADSPQLHQRKGLRRARQEPTKSHEWLRATMYYVGQKYNFVFGLPKSTIDRSSFCSELVVKVYERMGFEIVGSRPEAVIPADLESLSLLPTWRNVTDGYAQYLKEFHKEDEAHREELYRRSLEQSYATIAAALLIQIEAIKRRQKINEILPGLLGDLDRIEKELASISVLHWKVQAEITAALEWVRKLKKSLHRNET